MSDLPQLRPETIQLAGNIVEFARTGNRAADKVNAEVARTAYFIAQYYLNSAKQPIKQSTDQRRGRSQGSIEPFPSTWVVDPPGFKRAVAAFACDTAEIRNLQAFHEYEASTPRGSISDEPNHPSDQSERRSSGSTEDIPRQTPARQFPGMAQPPMNRDDLQAMIRDAVRENVREAVTAALTGYQPNQPRHGSPGPPGEPGPPGPPGADGNGNGNGNTKAFRPRDIGLFDPNPDLDPVEVKDEKQVYHNVFSFTNRLRVKASTMDPAVLRQNVESCLLGKADRWYTQELAHITRVSMRNDNNGVKEWCKALEARFKESPSRALALLEGIRYTVQDARRRRDPVDYVQSIILHGQNSTMATTDYQQVMLVYEHMDAELRRDLPHPNPQSTIAGLIEVLNEEKNIWFDLYSSQNTTANSSQSYQQQGRNRFPTNARFGPNPPFSPYSIERQAQFLNRWAP